MGLGSARARRFGASLRWSDLVVAVATGAFLAVLEARRPDLGDLVQILALLSGTVVLHEAGHALVSLLVGHSLFEIRIGVGPEVRLRLGSARLVLGALPFGGHVLSASGSEARYRAKRLSIIGGGVATNALVLGAIVAGDVRSGALWTLAMLNCLVLVTNLLPMSVRSGLGPRRTDGLALIRTVLASPAALAEERAGFHLIRAQRATEAGDRDGARAIIRAALEITPDSPSLRNWLGHDLAASHRYAEAREVFGSLVRDTVDTRSERARRAIYLNNLAWADLMLGDDELRAEADAASAAAIEALPAHPAVQGTRAFALVSMGRLREGVALAERAHARHRDPKDKALTAAVIAIAQARDWRFPDARRWLLRAQSLDPFCSLLGRALGEISGGGAPDRGTLAESG